MLKLNDRIQNHQRQRRWTPKVSLGT
jgi:hypothetical protein